MFMQTNGYETFMLSLRSEGGDITQDKTKNITH